MRGTAEHAVVLGPARIPAPAQEPPQTGHGPQLVQEITAVSGKSGAPTKSSGTSSSQTAEVIQQSVSDTADAGTVIAATQPRETSSALLHPVQQRLRDACLHGRQESSFSNGKSEAKQPKVLIQEI